MGKLRIVPNGLRLEGQAEFIRPLYVQEIKAEDGQVMHLESSKSIKLQARGEANESSGSLVLGDGKLQVACDAFEVFDSDGNLRMSVTEDDITVGVDDMKYLGKAVFEGSIQTPTLKSPSTKSLQLTSENSKVAISGEGVSIKTHSGDVELISADNIHIESLDGSIFLESKDIFMKNIALSEISDADQSYSDVYQLCMCASGRVFLGAASGDCHATRDICGNS